MTVKRGGLQVGLIDVEKNTIGGDEMTNEQATGDAISRCELFNRLADVQTIADAYAVIQGMPVVEPEAKPIVYQECANAMLKMWMDKVITDGEYNRIMDKLNIYHSRKNGSCDKQRGEVV